MFTWTPISFPAKLLSEWVVPSMYWCMWLSFCRCRIWHFLLDFRFVSVHFPSLMKCLGMAAGPAGVSANTQRLHCAPATQRSQPYSCTHTSNSHYLLPMLHVTVHTLQKGSPPHQFPRKDLEIFPQWCSASISLLTSFTSPKQSFTFTELQA